MFQHPRDSHAPSNMVPWTIEADWQLTDVCNMNCRYCFSIRTREHDSRPTADPARYLTFFNSTGERWSLHMTGGEPFLYPGFVELCRTLSQDHFLSVNTNLSSPLVIHFSETLDPSRVEYIHCCLHLTERERLNNWTALETNLRSLTLRHFTVIASQIMTPDAFPTFTRAAQRLANLGVVLIPKSLQGLFQGKWYPHCYSEGEKEQFRALSNEAEVSLGALTPNLHQRAITVNPLLDREYLNGFPLTRGIPCAAGRRFFTIWPNGDIYRCGKNHLLGNINDGMFAPLPSSTPCDSSYYPYFCLQHSELKQKATKQTPIALQVQPSMSSKMIHGLLRTGRKMLRQRLPSRFTS